MTEAVENARFRDFSFTPPPLYFTIDGERYDCYVIIPVPSMQEIANLRSSGIQDAVKSGRLEAIAEILSPFMFPESYERLSKRIMSKDRPLDLAQQVLPILHWLMEQHGLRPTEPSENSSDSSHDEESGSSSTDGAPREESTLST